MAGKQKCRGTAGKSEVRSRKSARRSLTSDLRPPTSGPDFVLHALPLLPLSPHRSHTIRPTDYLGPDSQLDEMMRTFVECAEQEALSAAQMAVVSAEIQLRARALRLARDRHLASHPDLLPNDE